MAIGAGIRRLSGVTLLLSLGATLALAGSAQASDARSGDASDRLFYGASLTQEITTFGTEVGEPTSGSSPSTCTRGATPTLGVTMGKTAWYRIVGSGATIELSTAGSTSGASPMDTVLAVYEVGGTTPIACSDDTEPLTDVTSHLSVPTTANTVYEVQAGAYGAANGNSCASLCVLRLAATNPSAPANDNRASATSLISSTIGNNDYATEEPSELNTCPNQGPNQNLTRTFAKTLWYAFTAPATGTATFRSGGGVDTVEALYEGASPTFIVCNDDDGTGTLSSRITASVNGGATYFLQVGGFNGSHGAFTVSVDFVPNHDLDGDGYLGAQFGGPDCDDSNAAIHPGAADVPGDGVDENCDGRDSTAATGPPPTPHCIVPKLTGRSLGAVRKRLGKAHCRLGKVSGRKSRSAAVKRQGVKPGKVLPAGAKVDVVVG